MDFKLETPDELTDPTLLGNRVEAWISRWFPRLAKWSHDNDCGCDRRKEWLNTQHLKFREWRT